MNTEFLTINKAHEAILGFFESKDEKSTNNNHETILVLRFKNKEEKEFRISVFKQNSKTKKIGWGPAQPRLVDEPREGLRPTRIGQPGLRRSPTDQALEDP